jgi:hypothetical protein
MKKNCWEHKLCGREPGGQNVFILGVCPAAVEESLGGMHGGKNGGRSCWVVAGTLCGGEVQGSFAAKFDSCEQCDFYQVVKKEEFPKFEFAVVLLKRLQAVGPDGERARGRSDSGKPASVGRVDRAVGDGMDVGLAHGEEKLVADGEPLVVRPQFTDLAVFRRF